MPLCLSGFNNIFVLRIAYKHKKNYICSVKNYISKIFAVYILILALIPCTDICSTSVCLLNEKLHIEQNTQEDEHCDDLCSPLCVCLCCNEVTSVSDIFIFEHFNNHTTFFHSDNLHSSYHYLESTSPPPKS